MHTNALRLCSNIQTHTHIYIYVYRLHTYLFTCIESTNCLHRYLLVAAMFSQISQQKIGKQLKSFKPIAVSTNKHSHTHVHTYIHSTNRYVSVKIEK